MHLLSASQPHLHATSHTQLLKEGLKGVAEMKKGHKQCCCMEEQRKVRSRGIKGITVCTEDPVSSSSGVCLTYRALVCYVICEGK